MPILSGEWGRSHAERGAERLDTAIGGVADAAEGGRALRPMQRDALAHAVNDALEFVDAMRLDIRDGAGGGFAVKVKVAVGGDEAEGHDLDGAATALGVERDPEFAPPRRCGAKVYQDEGHQLLAEDVEELDGRARGADIITSHAQLREQGNRDGVITLIERNEWRGPASVML
jgi:hypothetical protein